MAIYIYQMLKPLLLPTFLFIILFSSTSHSISDVEALLKFKNSLSNPGTLNSWDPNTPPCIDKYAPWQGVVCFDGVVVGLHLKSMGLSGNMDVDALANIPGLRTISLEDNNFTGPLPELNRLGALKAVYLSNNQFNGQISTDFFLKMESLKKLWLANNTFSGNIPSSLTQLRNLIELHLENNRFSGVIPPLKQPPLVSLNMSNNQLQGEIPMSLLNFESSCFVGNPKLCGEIIGVDCITEIGNNEPPQQTNTETSEEGLSSFDKPPTKGLMSGRIAWGISIVLVLLALLVIAVFLTKRETYEEYIPTRAITPSKNNDEASASAITTASTATVGNTRSRDNNGNEGAVEVDVEPILQKSTSGSSTISSTSSKRSNSDRSSRRGTGKGGSSTRGEPTVGGLGQGDLTMVNDERGVIGLADLMKASAEVLGNGGIGSAYKAIMANGFGVVVKRMRELNNLENDAFDLEIRKLASLRHGNILPPLAYHYRKDEKLVVYEYVPKGSLHYLLHGKIYSHIKFPNLFKVFEFMSPSMFLKKLVHF